MTGVDIRLTTKTKKIIHIELQVEKRANTRSRIVYYASKQISDQLKWGDDYNKLHQVISVVICNHLLLEEEETHFNEYGLINKRSKNNFTDLLKVVILELPKLPETEDNALWPWLRFLKCKKQEEYTMLAKKYPELEKPIYCVKKMSLFEKWRDIQFHKNLAKVDERMLHEQWRLDGIAEGKVIGIEQGIKQGIKQGIEQGEVKGNAEGKAELKAEILDLIARGLSAEEIKQRLGN